MWYKEKWKLKHFQSPDKEVDLAEHTIILDAFIIWLVFYLYFYLYFNCCLNPSLRSLWYFWIKQKYNTIQYLYRQEFNSNVSVNIPIINLNLKCFCLSLKMQNQTRKHTTRSACCNQRGSSNGLFRYGLPWMHFHKLLNVFVQMIKCICPSCKMYLS